MHPDCPLQNCGENVCELPVEVWCYSLLDFTVSFLGV